MLALNEARLTAGMPPISVVLNLLWIVFGGLWMAAAWMIAAIVMAIGRRCTRSGCPSVVCMGIRTSDMDNWRRHRNAGAPQRSGCPW